jgi:hypothetical protein
MKSKGHLDFQKKEFLKEIPWETCYSIESSKSSKAREFPLSGKSNGRCDENDISNS